ncbi:C6 finger domain protein [Aspergillus avenaceus]|uniref:C6 finger domain protein n=1 Tax=Aspergillus avenaceus TaxID=36643 RepID=A0A5N6TU77_ASPAV|nr:C6 finger domain protein [Aspergillus avenaceus]
MIADPEYRNPISRRFNQPPVKLACLSCRALRIRCDGRTECANCVTKRRSCSYVPSQRGGPRYCSSRKRKCTVTISTPDTPFMEEPNFLVDTCRTAEMTPPSEWFNQLGGLCGQGAGLRSVEMPFAEIDSIFDSIFGTNQNEATSDRPGPESNPVRLYGSNEDILDAYYVFIHMYFPILPPPARLPISSRPLPKGPPTFEPTSPLSLAISALLALIPHPNESDPRRAEYVKRRRDYAHCFAQTALGVIEKDYELLSITQNPRASEDGLRSLQRKQFHPGVEVSLEGVIALTLLSVYEYVQKGSLDNMLQRANQSVALAMSMALHEAVEEDGFADSRRRVWWMTYMTACQASAVSGTAPAFDLYDPWVVIPYPEGWKLMIEAQQILVESSTYALDLERTADSDDTTWVSKRMVELDKQISSLLFRCREAPPVSQMAPEAASIESMASKTMKDFAEIKLNTARIKLHRLCAFQDIMSGADSNADSETPTNLNKMDILSELNSNPILVSDVSLLSRIRGLQLPFSSAASSKFCLHAALNIVTLLDNLVHPKHTSENPTSTNYAYGNAGLELPRTMPTVVCCGMQSSYAMLMLSLKARAIQTAGPDSVSLLDAASLSDFRNELYHNLRLIIKCLANYAIAFEAIQGIMDKLERAIEREFLS